jgi:hypothetical protein
MLSVAISEVTRDSVMPAAADLVLSPDAMLTPPVVEPRRIQFIQLNVGAPEVRAAEAQPNNITFVANGTDGKFSVAATALAAPVLEIVADCIPNCGKNCPVPLPWSRAQMLVSPPEEAIWGAFAVAALVTVNSFTAEAVFAPMRISLAESSRILAPVPLR